ncbi:MAG: hypothetical protein WAL91_10390, partial [Propionicimonas sp.]
MRPDASLPREELLSRLRAQAEAPAGSRAHGLLRVPTELSGLLPGGGLKPGSAYCLDSAGALLHALLAEPSREGVWCGVVGVPDFGVEAASRAGVHLDRLVLVPEPEDQELAVCAALAEVLPLVALRAPRRVTEAEAARLGARLRDRGGVLLVHGPWPRAEARLSIAAARWLGLGSGYGHLDGREVTVVASSRR